MIESKNEEEENMSFLNRVIVTTLPAIPKPIVGHISRRYIAGDTMGDAIKTIRQLQDEGCCATVDLLGEHITRKDEALTAVENYLQALDVIKAENLDSNVSVKLTQIGLQLDYNFCLENMTRLLDAAKAHNNFVRIDMEDATCTTNTLRVYKHLAERYDNVGVVLQSYMRRSKTDIDDLAKHVLHMNIRLCKGIYDESREIAYKDPEIIRSNYVSLLTRLFKTGAYVGIATHDERLVWHALELVEQLQVPQNKFEFQMLLGVDAQLRRIIVNAGHKLRVYVPFGKHWYAYSVRRLKENPKIAGYIFTQFFRGNSH